MRKSIFTILGIAGIVAIMGYNSLQTEAHAFPAGAPAGQTGSPLDGSNCTSCHGGTASSVAVTNWLSTTIPATGYVPGQTYSITVTTNPNGNVKQGFQLAAQTSAANVGTFIAGSGSQLVSGGYVTHTSAVNSSSPRSWTFQWQAPAQGVGAVTFHLAGVIGKTNVRLTNLTVQQATVGIAENTQAFNLQVFPNPSTDVLKLQYSVPTSTGVNLDIIDLTGKTIQSVSNGVQQGAQDLTIDVSNLAKGTYFVYGTIGASKVSQRFIVK